ncbi:MAG TPA: Maf family nucleotide pyrophosphatase, partial [Saprospiraceae bacterium]|nr:Maf family nucleotide pyrophosphatase [Saprospiraceae bacterium]
SMIVPKFTIFTLNVDESFDEVQDVFQVAAFLAEKKAKAILPYLPPNQVLITADSVVIVDNEILNKPEDKTHACQMLQKLSGKWHFVQTGMAISKNGIVEVFVETSKVLFDELSPSLIERYVDECQPFDKAGSYGIQDWIGFVGVKKIEGSYSNIMGLPVQRLYRELLAFLDK